MKIHLFIKQNIYFIKYYSEIYIIIATIPINEMKILSCDTHILFTIQIIYI